MTSLISSTLIMLEYINNNNNKTIDGQLDLITWSFYSECLSINRRIYAKRHYRKSNEEQGVKVIT